VLPHDFLKTSKLAILLILGGKSFPGEPERGSESRTEQNAQSMKVIPAPSSVGGTNSGKRTILLVVTAGGVSGGKDVVLTIYEYFLSRTGFSLISAGTIFYAGSRKGMGYLASRPLLHGLLRWRTFSILSLPARLRTARLRSRATGGRD